MPSPDGPDPGRSAGGRFALQLGDELFDAGVMPGVEEYAAAVLGVDDHDPLGGPLAVVQMVDVGEGQVLAARQ